ncbi:MAG: hypothetical protein ACR2PX_00405 [Endozoicomonas sp.]|uniref:hypothetical protein n=1 Tax=Endozoicomonas sp. TaxID=1892382 RepID=UPI003D9B46FE
MNPNNDPESAFINETQGLAALLDEFQRLIDDRFEVNPDDINWAQVCMLRELTNRLSEALMPWRDINAIQNILSQQKGDTP